MGLTFETGFKSTTSKPVAPGDTEIFLATVPTRTSGRLYIANGAQEEWIKYTGVTATSVTGCTRTLSKTAVPATGSTGLSWLAGTTVKLVAMHDQMDDQLETTTITGEKTFTEPIVTSEGVIATSYASTAARDAALGGDGVATRNYMNIKAGSAFYNYNLSTGLWEIVSTGATPPDMTEGVAGIGERTSTAEAIGGVDNNGSNSMVTKPSDVLIVGAYHGGINTTYNMAISASRAGNAETISLLTKAGTAPSATDPITIGFRNVTAGTGDFTYLSITSATTLTIPNTATMGATNAVPFRLWLVGFNDGGTFRLGVVNTQTTIGIMALDDDLLKSSTTIGTGSDSAGVIYSGTGVTTKAMRLLGYLDYTLAAIGVRDTAPSKVQIFGPGIKKPGDIVQVAYTSSSGFTDISTVVPYDDTIPQVGEGTEVFSVSLTQTANANKVLVDSVITGAVGSSQNVIASLYQNGATDAIMTVDQTTVSNGNMATLPISYMGIAGTTSPTVLSLRVGPGSASTFTLNGAAGARKFGTVAKSYMKVTEIMV